MHVRSPVASLLRIGQRGRQQERLDLIWLGALLLSLIVTGIGLRDPWPADEPRFALIARDMAASGQWLIPLVGGDVYADKPPLFFWIMAALLKITGSLRWAFLLPSAFAAVGCVVLVYDLARRLWNRDVGLAAGLTLLFTIQFVWQARQAQIDATLCFFTTLGLYGLLRHCLLGPAWKWYAIGWASCGLGILTKGVGFLPLLVLVPYVFARRNRWDARLAIAGGWRWMTGPLVLIMVVGAWLVPLLIAAEADPTLQRYRDEILLGQTVRRFVAAAHHHEPIWYFIVEVIPALWLPITALVPWLIPKWRAALQAKDARVALLLAWIALVVLFFSLSTGKRGVYVLPAVPALALVAAPYIGEILQRGRAQLALFVLAAGCAVVAFAALAFTHLSPAQGQQIAELYGIDVRGPLWILAAGIAAICAFAQPRRGAVAWGGLVALALSVVSLYVSPAINDHRSGRAFVHRVESHANDVAELGLVAYKEQYLLYSSRPTVSFGHRRWQEGWQETFDAAAWIAGRADRALMMKEAYRARCFGSARSRFIGVSNRERWFLVDGSPAPECVAQGDAGRAILYVPPRGFVPR
jgi:4-amino-4-deoxy-L-arabinose transferase-like glycosyltransferase